MQERIIIFHGSDDVLTVISLSSCNDINFSTGNYQLKQTFHRASLPPIHASRNQNHHQKVLPLKILYYSAYYNTCNNCFGITVLNTLNSKQHLSVHSIFSNVTVLAVPRTYLYFCELNTSV